MSSEDRFVHSMSTREMRGYRAEVGGDEYFQLSSNLTILRIYSNFLVMLDQYVNYIFIEI